MKLMAEWRGNQLPDIVLTSHLLWYGMKDEQEMVFTIYDGIEARMYKTMTNDMDKTKSWSIKQIFHNDQSNFTSKYPGAGKVASDHTNKIISVIQLI